MSNHAKKILIESVASETSETLKAIGLDLLDIVFESGLYISQMKLLNMSHPGMLYGSIDLVHRDSYIGVGGNSINIDSFDVDESLTLRIKKKITIGYNTNNDVSKYEGHDYIAPSVNNSCVVIEEFKIINAMDILDKIEDVMYRNKADQVSALRNIKFSTGNGKNQDDFFRAALK